MYDTPISLPQFQNLPFADHLFLSQCSSVELFLTDLNLYLPNKKLDY